MLLIPGLPHQTRDVMQSFFTGMQAGHRSRFLVHKRLHAQAHAVHAAGDQRLNHGLSQSTGSAFNRNLRAGSDAELLRDGGKQFSQLFRRQQAGSAPAQID